MALFAPINERMRRALFPSHPVLHLFKLLGSDTHSQMLTAKRAEENSKELFSDRASLKRMHYCERRQQRERTVDGSKVQVVPS